MCGFLPLYIAMAGRMIFEVGPSSEWETELVALLAESKSSVLGGDGSGGGELGSQIVGSSLSQVRDPNARRLFVAMAAAAEDVQVPMPALELVWCAKEGLEPPLGRLAMMKLRRCCFTLLDRNLLMGETVTGVFLHDVVREYCRGLAGPELTRQLQRDLTSLLFATTPILSDRIERHKTFSHKESWLYAKLAFFQVGMHACM